MKFAWTAAAVAAGIAVSVALVPSVAGARERLNDGLMGAGAGALVGGPVGAVAGGVIGYTAGPSISRGMGFHRHRPYHRHRHSSANQGTGHTVR